MKTHLFKLERTLERLLGGQPAREPLEIRRAVVDALLADVQPIGRGRRTLPYSRVTVHVLATGTAEKRVLTEALVGPGGAEGDARRELERVGALPGGFSFTVRFARAPGRDWQPGSRFHVSVSSVAADAPDPQPTPEPAGGPPPRSVIRIVTGKATATSVALEGGRLTIGRQVAVTDTDGRVVRRNDVAFVGDDDASRSVSRAHGCIAWDAAAGAYRVFDEGSAHGTQIARAGRLIRVPGGRSGLKLQPGDEIHAGRAVLKFDLKPRKA